MAEAGIILLGYHFMATYVWRTDMRAAGRGGARVTSFDLAAAGEGNALDTYKLTPDEPLAAPISAEQMWANHQYFLDAVLPVAESVGVRLALHPDDPPVDAPLGGAARIFTSPAALSRAARAGARQPVLGAESLPRHGVGDGRSGRRRGGHRHLRTPRPIRYVHFRDVRGTVPAFSECFLGEGNYVPAAVLTRLHAAGFDGFLIDDHVPAMVGDPDTWAETFSAAYCSRGRAHAIGYLQGVLDGLRWKSRSSGS